MVQWLTLKYAILTYWLMQLLRLAAFWVLVENPDFYAMKIVQCRVHSHRLHSVIQYMQCSSCSYFFHWSCQYLQKFMDFLLEIRHSLRTYFPLCCCSILNVSSSFLGSFKGLLVYSKRDFRINTCKLLGIYFKVAPSFFGSFFHWKMIVPWILHRLVVGLLIISILLLALIRIYTHLNCFSLELCMQSGYLDLIVLVECHYYTLQVL